MDISYYNYLAEDYDHKRQKPWKALQEFLHCIDIGKLKSSNYCVDIGCGNGRNFPLISLVSKHIIGIDSSVELLKRAQKKLTNQLEKNTHTQLILSSVTSIPIRPKVINGAFIIAVIHHIKSDHNRTSIMQQIFEIIKDNGWVIASVWRKYQKKFRWFFIKDFIKRMLCPKYLKAQKRLGLVEYGDKTVPWTLSKEGKTYHRFYHFFSYREGKNLMNDFLIAEMIKLGGPGKKDNFFFFLNKNN